MQISVPHAPFGWAEGLPYSQAVVAGDLVFCAGTGGFGADGEIVEGGFEAQLRQAFANLKAALESAGSSLEGDRQAERLPREPRRLRQLADACAPSS